MELQKLYSYVRQAIEKYGMIREGDHIAVGISGGKDSLTLLYALAGLRDFYPKAFSLTAVTVHLGLPGMDFTPVRTLCEQLKVPYEIVETRIGEIVFDVRKEKHPCALCAKLRKGALNEKALELGCNKIAYAHLTLLRPVRLVPEAQIRGVCRRYERPVVETSGPADGNTARERVKGSIRQLQQQYPNIRERVFTAICRADFEDWMKDS